MGGWLTIETLRQLRLTGRDAVLNRLNVVLAAPDIDVDVFRQQVSVIGPLSPPMTLLVSSDDRALSISSRISGARERVGALNVTDPRVQETAMQSRVRIIDISETSASNRLNHDRYVYLAALYPRIVGPEREGPGDNIQRAGAFVLDTAGAILTAPFAIVNQARAGN